MSLISLLTYDYTNQKNWIARTDPRIKLIFSIMILSGAIIISELFPLLSVLLLSILPVLILDSFKHLFKILFSLKWLFIIYFGLRFIIAGYMFDLMFLMEMIKILIVLFSFYSFNKTTSPEQITDLLLKLRLPSGLAWSIGASIRQANFLIEDVQFLSEIQANRRNMVEGRKNVREKLEKVLFLLSSIFSRSIINSDNYASTLVSRQWKGAHRELVLNSPKLRKEDLLVFVLVILIPLFIYFLYSRDIYI